MLLARRSIELPMSQTVGMANTVMELARAGKTVLTLNEGELDFDTPGPVIEATRDALSKGLTRYSFLNGEPPLLDLICEKLAKDNGVTATPDNVIVTNGSKQVIYEIIHTLVEEGDEVIIPIPCWPTYIDVVRLAGGTPVLVDIGESDLNAELIARHVGPRTKLIIVNSPNNPTGAVYSEEALRSLCLALRGKPVYLLSDEAYERITFDGHRALSIAALGLYDPAYMITTQTFSKGYAMTGYRVGYAVAPTNLIAKLSAMHSQMTDNVCAFAQYGAIAALQLDPSVVAGWRANLSRRRDVALDYVRGLFECTSPKGAFYVFPDVTSRLDAKIPTSAALAELILRECGVASVPGEVFRKPGHLRFSFAAVPEPVIHEAFARIKRLLG